MSLLRQVIPTPPPHAESDRLTFALTRCRGRSRAWSGTAYRVTSVRRANEKDLVSGEGSRLIGQRWNPPGLFRTLYLSLDHQTALAEALAQNTRQGLPVSHSLPLVLTAFQVKLDCVLDHTDRRIRSILGVTLDTIISTPHELGPETITQAIGRLTNAACFMALLVPSAAVRGKRNLVIFRSKLAAKDLRIINKDELPTNKRALASGLSYFKKDNLKYFLKSSSPEPGDRCRIRMSEGVSLRRSPVRDAVEVWLGREGGESRFSLSA